MNNFIRAMNANPLSSILKMKVSRIKRRRYFNINLKSSSNTKFSSLKFSEYTYYFSEMIVARRLFGDVY
jgi:hypothetical protein